MTTLAATGRRATRKAGRALRRFGRDRRGAYAVEFGMVVMPFFGLFCGIMEVSWVSFNAEQLQAAVDKAARQIMTGAASGTSYPSKASFVSGLLCPNNSTQIIPSTWDCSRLIVDIRPATSFSTADTSKTFYTGPTQYCLGQPSTIEVVRVAYPMDAVFPLSIYNEFVGLSNDVPGLSGWYHMLMGTAAFKTESYPTASPTC